MTDEKTFVLIPADERGLLTNWSPYNMGNFANSFGNFRDIVIQNNAWQARTSDTNTSFSGIAAGQMNGIYYYNAVDTSSTTSTPVTLPMYHIGSGATRTIYFSAGTAVANTTAPHQPVFLTIKNRMYIAGATMTPVISGNFPIIGTQNWGKAGPITDLTYDPLNVKASNTAAKIFYQAANGTSTGVATIAAAAGTPYTASPTWDGKSVLFDNGTTYTIVSTTTGVITTTINVPAAATKDVQVFYGNLTWTTQGPSYAYAYYNPTTGHISNIGPVLTVSEQNQKNVNIAIRGIQGTNDATNYTRIVLFRTQMDSGGTLTPLFLDSAHGGTATIDASGMIVNNTAGTLTYFDGQPNSKLGTTLGAFPAPTINDPPPSDIKYMEYWDQRVWANTSSLPWRLRYSGDGGQIPLGVPEECWPAANFLDAAATDGIITGMRVVGDTLLVCTDKNIYYVSSSGGAYRLLKLSSRGRGVEHFAIDEHPGDTTSESASAVYVSRDKRLWRHFPGGRVEDIGYQIQDKLDASPNVANAYLVKVLATRKSWLLCLGIKDGSNAQYNFFFYDFDTRAWYDWGYGAIGSANPGYCVSGGYNYGTGVNDLLVGHPTNPNVYSIQVGTDAQTLQPTFTTQQLDMGSRRALKTLVGANVYVSLDTLTGWDCQFQLEGTGGFTGMTRVTTTGTPRFGGANIIKYAMPVAKQFHAAEIKVIWGLATAGLQPRVYRVELIYRVESTGEAGAPT